MIQQVLTQQSELQDNFQASIDQQVKESLLTALTEVLQMIEKLLTKVDELNPCTVKKSKRYCWTCGCRPRWGKDCPDKKPGHQDSATFKNRKGGSTQQKNCPLLILYHENKGKIGTNFCTYAHWYKN